MVFQRQMTADILTLEQAGEYKAPSDMFERIIKVNEELLNKLEANLIDYNELGLFEVRCEQFIKHFIEAQKININKLHRIVESHLEQKEKECRSFLVASIERLSQPMSSIENYVQQKENVANLISSLPEITDKLALLNSIPQLLPPLKIPGLQQNIMNVLVLGAQHSNLMSQMENLTTNSTDKFKKEYKELEKELNKNIEQMLSEVTDKKWLTLEQGADVVKLKGKMEQL
jgi:DNA anti-recombination protein RmuC